MNAVPVDTKIKFKPIQYDEIYIIQPVQSNVKTITIINSQEFQPQQTYLTL